MNDFVLWFVTGFRHILDWTAYDHICYIIVLTIVFPAKEWKKVLILISSFTIGHSLTLALCASNIIQVNSYLIELLIPLTIISTSITTIIKRKHPTKAVSLNYFFALFFGLIHGMGFSYVLKSMLGKEQSLIAPLLSFNLGIEIGQLILVSIILIISVFLENAVKINRAKFVFVVSSIVFIIASILLVERLYDKN